MMPTTSHLPRWLTVLTMATLLAVSGYQPAAARDRIALVIGNGAYQDLGVLTNATNDAALMASTLRKLDFEVIVNTDIDQKAMKRAIKAFGRQLDEAGPDAVGLFYFAGHGIQLQGANFLIPVGADIGREGDIDIEAVNLDWVLTQMEFAANDLNFLIIDACRNNPVVRSFRSATRGLAQVAAPRGTLIAYATEPGGVAADGDGDNSPYTLALAKNLQQPGHAAEEVFRQVRVDVLKATDQQQVPWEASSLTGAFYFSEGGDTVAAVTEGESDAGGTITAVDVAASPPVESAKPDDQQTKDSDANPKSVELALWTRIEDKDDPALFDLYLRQYPEGDFSDLAAKRRNQLGRQSRLPAALAEVKILPMNSMLYVQERANLRRRPSADSDLVTTLDAGLPVRVTGEVANSDWYRIAFAEDRQAFIWKPLVGVQAPATPAAQSLSIDAAAVDVAAIAGHKPPAPRLQAGALTGLWRGRYRCQDDHIGFSVDITEELDHRLAAVFEFYPVPGSPSVSRGSYAMSGQVTPGDRLIQLHGTDWIDRPVGFQQHDLEGLLDDDGDSISGQVLTVGCADFILSRND